MDWKKIVLIEPKIEVLSKLARKVRADEHFCANALWYRKFKPQVSKLVGYGASNNLLKSSGTYDLVTDKIYHQLPDCKKCGCL